ncbi:hypothetical protein HPP92_002651 [Vanilla planifolia]|uniref:Uncharacterized protein n=1 Tax=Vanilla planifolia TaxID=51239 RepID=A0A835S1X2_VANPL|nr:hypothetical protein HPP92_002651 [Vanilla planifolia]
MAFRRWVSKKIAEKFDDLYVVIGKESELVKIIAEVLEELDKSRKWAELHVADSCCFHYRRRLILKLLENCSKKGCAEGSHVYGCSSLALLEEELKWNVVLIHRYIGREALWVHRRFLSCYWMKYLTNQHALACPSELHPEVFPAFDRFLEEEVELLHTCLHIPADGFEETEAQSHHAATYMLWISKQILLPEFRMEEKLHELGGLKAILMKKCSEMSQIWERLLE